MASDKVTLTEEKETLLATLYGKAVESRRPHPILHDPKAEEIVGRINYDFSRLRVPLQSRLTVAMRAKRLDDYTRAFLARHQPGLILNLGCGLDSRNVRVNAPNTPWYDLDYPEVMDLRRQFYTVAPPYHLLGSSVTDWGWIDQVAERGPAIILAEGLLMYLPLAQVKELVLRLRERFPGSELAFDAFSVYAAARLGRHPSIRKTGAVIHWGLDDPRTLESWAPGIRQLEAWPFTASPDRAHLSFYPRLMFAVMGALPAAQNAHRVFHFQL